MRWLHTLVLLAAVLLFILLPPTELLLQITLLGSILLFYTTFLLAIRMIGKYHGTHRRLAIAIPILVSLLFLSLAGYMLQIIYQSS